MDIPPKPEWWNSGTLEEQVVTVKWNNQHNSEWNLICADVVEVFGLPGQRFYYKPYLDFMTFTFKSKQDADLCKILISHHL